MLKEYLVVDNKQNDNGKFQERIKEYLLNNCSAALEEKIISKGQNLGDCYQYIFEEVKKEYVKQYGKVNGGFYVSDEEIFGMAIHYFEDEELYKEEKPEEPQKRPITEVKIEPKQEVKETKKPATNAYEKLSIFDFLEEE